MKKLRRIAREVKKPNIVVLSKGSVTALQHKVYTALLYLARQVLDRLYEKERKGAAEDNVTENDLRERIAREHTVFETTLDAIHEIGGIQDKNRGERFRKTVLALTTTTCEYVNIYHKDSEDARTGAFAYLSSYEQTGCTVTYQLPFQITVRLLCRGWQYTFVDLYYLSRLHSIYARLLYEHISRVRAFRRLKLSVEQFRLLMGVPDESSYASNFSILRRRTIAPAVKEINEHTDVFITGCTEESREGKKITDLVFAWEIRQVLGASDAENSLRFQLLQQQKQLLSGKRQYDELCRLDPAFAARVERAMRVEMEKDPRFASLSLTVRIVKIVERMEFDNLVDVHMRANVRNELPGQV